MTSCRVRSEVRLGRRRVLCDITSCPFLEITRNKRNRGGVSSSCCLRGAGLQDICVRVHLQRLLCSAVASVPPACPLLLLTLHLLLLQCPPSDLVLSLSLFSSCSSFPSPPLPPRLFTSSSPLFLLCSHFLLPGPAPCVSQRPWWCLPLLPPPPLPPQPTPLPPTAPPPSCVSTQVTWAAVACGGSWKERESS